MKNKFFSRKRISYMLIISLVLFSLFYFIPGCKKERLNPYDHYAYKVVVFDTAGTNNVSQIISYDANSGTATFSSSVNVSVNDVIVSVPCASAPNGFLRKVIALNQNNTVAQTVQASLEEAIKDDSLEFSMELTQNKMNIDPGATKALKGVNLVEGRDKSFNFSLSLDDVVVYDDDGNENTTNDQIKLNGYVNFNTSYQVKIKIKDWKLEHFLFQNTSTEEANLELSTTLLSMPLIDEEITVWQHYFAPVTVGIVVIVPKLKLVLGANGEVSVNVTTDATQQASLTAGIKYENNNWVTFSDFTKSFQYNPPSLSAELDLKGYAGPQLDLLLYGVAGPYANLNAYVQLSAQTSFQNTIDWSLYGGIELVCGAEVEILSHVLANVEWKIIDYQITLANGQITGVTPPPVANFSASPIFGTAPLTVNFTDLSTNNPTSWSWNFGDGGTSTIQNPSHTYNSAGTYTVSLTATNVYGSGTETKNGYIVVSGGTGTVTDIDGNVYNTITIGTQVWMVENLKVTHYNDGTEIPLVTNGTTWANLTTPGYCWYNNDEPTYKTYGALYNWFTVITENLCPTGWHIPTNAEWTTLTDYLGGLTIAGGKLKETGTIHWYSPNAGATNESGFTALPGGGRNHVGSNGVFLFIGEECNFWSDSNNLFRSLFYDSPIVYENQGASIVGCSVRCIKD